MTLFEYVTKYRRFIEVISITTPTDSNSDYFTVQMLARKKIGGPLEQARIKVWCPKTLHWSFVRDREEETVKDLNNWFTQKENVDNSPPSKSPLVVKVRKVRCLK